MISALIAVLPLTGNTVEAETYIEEGYLPRWEAYKKWQTGTLNRRLVILELGEGFKTPTVMRWPFEKIGFFNQKSVFYRIHETFFQIPKETGERDRGNPGRFSCLYPRTGRYLSDYKNKLLYHVTMLKY